jgi:hypothetical protein
MLTPPLRPLRCRRPAVVNLPSTVPRDLQQQLLHFLLQLPLLHKLQGQVNNNGATPLLVAATWGQPQVYGRLLGVATADVLHTFTASGEA